jgi:hypothetical protein
MKLRGAGHREARNKKGARQEGGTDQGKWPIFLSQHSFGIKVGFKCAYKYLFEAILKALKRETM